MNLLRSILLLAAIASIGGSAWAADEFDRHACSVALLQAKSVQKELGITEAQRAKMNVHADWNNRQGADIDRRFNRQALTSAQAADAARKIRSDLKKKVLGELTSAQIIRLREISLQQAGALALMDAVVAKKIGMSKAQTDKIRTKYVEQNRVADKIKSDALAPLSAKYGRMKKPATEDEARRIQEQFRKERLAKEKEILPKLNALAVQFDKTVEAMMTKAQIESYKKIKGKTFKPDADSS